MAVINRDTLRLVWGMARHGAPDAESLAVINSVSSSINSLLDALETNAKAQQAAQEASRPKSAVEESGIGSAEAQNKRDIRKEKRLAEGTETKVSLLPWKDYDRLSPRSILRRCEKAGPVIREKVLNYERSHEDRVQIITTLESWKQ